MLQTTPTGTVHNGQSPGNPNSWVLVTAAQAGDRDAFGQLYALWVPNWSSTSCDLGVFVYQPVEHVATSDVRLG
jgi:hypothetical protein